MAHHHKPRRGARPRLVEEIILGFGIILMFDHLIAVLTKLSTDDHDFTNEIAGLEQAKADIWAKQAADEQAFSALDARVAALEGAGTADTGALATKADLDGLGVRVGEIEHELDDLDAQLSGLGGGAGPTAVAGAPIAVDVSGVPGGAMVGEAFAGNVLASGGSGPLNFAIDSGALPDGLRMAAGGAISGTPGTTGDFAADVAVSDANGDVGRGTVAISVAEAVAEPAPEPAPEPVSEPTPEPAPGDSVQAEA